MFDRTIGLEVLDDTLYSQYRAEMTPLLEAAGGRFILDVRVSEVLRGPDGARFNRLFTLRFPSESDSIRFFADPGYLAIRERLFTRSVGQVHLLAAHQSVDTP
jgi:uncharacterized protein (DUF1330 family)